MEYNRVTLKHDYGGASSEGIAIRAPNSSAIPLYRTIDQSYMYISYRSRATEAHKFK